MRQVSSTQKEHTDSVSRIVIVAFPHKTVLSKSAANLLDSAHRCIQTQMIGVAFFDACMPTPFRCQAGLDLGLQVLNFAPQPPALAREENVCSEGPCLQTALTLSDTKRALY